MMFVFSKVPDQLIPATLLKINSIINTYWTLPELLKNYLSDYLIMAISVSPRTFCTRNCNKYFVLGLTLKASLG